MKVLVACEMSGNVRDAFIRHGHEAVSCDILPATIRPGPHIQSDIRDVDVAAFDLMVAFPPCTRLCRSGARWWPEHMEEQEEGIELFMWLVNAPVDRIAIENPIGIMSTRYRKPDQIIQPWQFGHGETKATCLWLKNLPKLVPTRVVTGREDRIHNHIPAGPSRSLLRSITYPGIAEAMADQWGREAS